MRALVFDPFHGAAGDMIIGALLGCGADRGQVTRAMRSVVAEPAISTVARAGIMAVKVETHAGPARRTFAEVTARLDSASADVPAGALAMARRVFERINAAEEQIHGTPVHFHEVGADDAIADVVGACTALHALGPDTVAVLPVALGQGMGEGQHGRFPVPSPATVQLLRGSGLAVVPGGGDGELCTPTGAALLSEFSTVPFGSLGAFTITGVGYGAGTRNPPHTPNVLRAMVVETAGGNGGFLQDSVDVLETNVDDESGEVIAHAISRCMAAGARDASAIPIIMKKGRPGYLLRAICLPGESAGIADLMARELGTLGIRCTPAVHRLIADRTIEQVGVAIAGQHRVAPVKCGRIHGKIYTIKAEFDHAQAWARELGIPVRQVCRAIEEAGWKKIGELPEEPGAG